MTFKAGDRVRLIHDPGKTGTLTGKTRARGGTTRYQVNFNNQLGYQPDYELELIPDENPDAYELIDKGKFGRVSDLRRSISHIQLGGKLSNLVYSMDTTNTDFYAYQFKPVLSFLESPSNGLLIADEVGLGKTIEAGLIWTELRARYDARRLLVVCPAMLREKWKLELQRRFSVDAEIMNAEELLQELSTRNIHEIADGKGLVCSLEGIRPSRNWEYVDNPSKPDQKLARFLLNNQSAESLIDLLIVDEAHYLRNPQSQNSKLGNLLRDVSAHVVLLSATPVNLRNEDLFHLLKIVDPDSFDDVKVFPEIMKANAPLQEAREKTLDRRTGFNEILKLLSEARGYSMLRNSKQLEQLISSRLDQASLDSESGRVALANQIEKINLLRHAVNRTRKIEVDEWKVIREPYMYFVELSDAETRFYDLVTEAVRDYASKSEVNEGFLLSGPQRQVSSSMYAAATAWKNRSADMSEFVYEDLGISVPEQENKAGSPLVDHMWKHVLPEINLEELRDQDSKYRDFQKYIREYLNENPKEKIIVFSYYRSTIRYLAERMDESGVSSQILMGGMKQTKHEIIEEFKESPEARILLSTEVASEGVDLQFCRVLVNYDLPWNPMKIEQRIGRLDRIGQNAKKISIWNLCYKNTIDHRIHERLLERLDIFRHALGGLEAILGEEIKKLTNDLFSKRLSPEQENKRIEATAMAVERNRADEKDLEDKAGHLIAHGGYILEKVNDAHEFQKKITDRDLVIYVKDYLEKFCIGHQFIQSSNKNNIFTIKLPAKAAAMFDDFLDSQKLRNMTRLATGESVDCEFMNRLTGPTKGKERLNQFHPLIRFINHEMNKQPSTFYPLVALRLARDKAGGCDPGNYTFAVQKWSFKGLRTEEELRVRAFNMDMSTMLEADESWDLLNLARQYGEDWLAAPNLLEPDEVSLACEKCENWLTEDYTKTSQEKELENDDRISFQRETIINHRDRRLDIHYGALEKLKADNRTALIPAREALIRKEEEKYDVENEKLNSREKLRRSQMEICIGAIQIY